MSRCLASPVLRIFRVFSGQMPEKITTTVRSRSCLRRNWGKWGWESWELVPPRPAENKQLAQVGSRIGIFSRKRTLISLESGHKKERFSIASFRLARHFLIFLCPIVPTSGEVQSRPPKSAILDPTCPKPRISATFRASFSNFTLPHRPLGPVDLLNCAPALFDLGPFSLPVSCVHRSRRTVRRP